MFEEKKIQKSKDNYRVKRPSQTGFSSPATHYNEPCIDLNKVLVKNQSATFFVRVSDDSYSDLNIYNNDVLIIDKSLTPKQNQLVLVIKEGKHKVIRIDKSKKDEELFIWGVVTYIINSVT